MGDSRSDIWRLQAQFDIQGLIQALKSPDANIRRRAAAALRTIGAGESVPALKAALALEGDPAARESLLSALEVLEELPVVAEPVATVTVATTAPFPEDSTQASRFNLLIEQLKSNSVEQVMQAAEKLGEMGDKLAVEPLVLLFNNVNAPIQIRLAVAEALLKLESAPVEVALLANLRHPDWHIRRNGAAILGQLKAEWAVEPLGRALSDPHDVVRKTATAALKYIGTPEARKILARYATGMLQQRRESAATMPAKNQPSRLLDKDKPADPPTPSETLSMAEGVALLAEVKAVSAHIKPANTEGHDVKTSPLDASAVDEYENRRHSDNTSE